MMRHMWLPLGEGSQSQPNDAVWSNPRDWPLRFTAALLPDGLAAGPVFADTNTDGLRTDCDAGRGRDEGGSDPARDGHGGTKGSSAAMVTEGITRTGEQ